MCIGGNNSTTAILNIIVLCLEFNRDLTCRKVLEIQVYILFDMAIGAQNHKRYCSFDVANGHHIEMIDLYARKSKHRRIVCVNQHRIICPVLNITSHRRGQQCCIIV